MKALIILSFLNAPFIVTIARFIGLLIGTSILTFILFGVIVKIRKPNRRLIFVPFIIQTAFYLIVDSTLSIVVSIIPNVFFALYCLNNSKESVDTIAIEKASANIHTLLNIISKSVPNAQVSVLNMNTDPVEFVYTFATKEEAESYSLSMECIEGYAFKHSVVENQFKELRPINKLSY